MDTVLIVPIQSMLHLLKRKHLKYKYHKPSIAEASLFIHGLHSHVMDQLLNGSLELTIRETLLFSLSSKYGVNWIPVITIK